MGKHTWITMESVGLRPWQDVVADIAAECESEAEKAMARILYQVAFDRVVEYERAYFIITPQHDLQPTHGIPYRADFMVISALGPVVVEVDGFAWHSDQGAFQRDRRRDRAFAAAHLPVMRFTAKECLDPGDYTEDDGVHAELRKAMR